jgi:epoxyqueuosine reductase
LQARAAALGFDLARITTPEAIPQAPERLRAWLAAGRHGSMGWMEDTEGRRAGPLALWPEVRSIVMLGLNYGPATDPMASLDRRDCGTISAYARGRDYHDVIKGKLKELAGFLAARAGEDVKVFVDTAPVMEKPLAEAAGLGWQGKHTVLVSRDFGNWLFLGAIFTTASCRPTPRRPTIAAPAAAASMPARRAPSRRRTSSMQGAASPT